MAQLSAPARHYLSTEAGSAGLLLGATLIALLWAKSPWSGSYQSLWATEAALSLGRWELSMAARVRADVASAEASRARGTPTFFVGDARHTGPHDTETLAAALAASRVGDGVPDGR